MTLKILVITRRFCYECLVGKLDSGPGQHRCPSCYQEVTSADVVEGEGSGTSEELPPSEGSDEGNFRNPVSKYSARGHCRTLYSNIGDGSPSELRFGCAL